MNNIEKIGHNFKVLLELRTCLTKCFKMINMEPYLDFLDMRIDISESSVNILMEFLLKHGLIELN